MENFITYADLTYPKSVGINLLEVVVTTRPACTTLISFLILCFVVQILFKSSKNKSPDTPMDNSDQKKKEYFSLYIAKKDK